jgi:hypothetical protein
LSGKPQIGEERFGRRTTVFQMAKVWIDPNNRVDSVEIRYTWSPVGTSPDFTNGKDEAEVMHVVPGTNPPVRQAVIEIPRYLDGKDNYLLHYHFGGGGEHHEGFTQVYTEEIVSKEVEFIDQEGLLTEVRVLWSVGGWAAPNWTQARLDGLPLQVPIDAPGHDIEGEGLADEAIYELVQTVPLPRRFVARVWGPRGGRVEYCYQLLRSNTPIEGDEFVHWDNNQNQNFSIVLS